MVEINGRQYMNHWDCDTGYIVRMAVHPMLEKCEPLIFIMDNEIIDRVSIDTRYDILIIPYDGFEDEYTREAIKKKAQLMPLEDFIEYEGDFEMTLDNGRKMSIKSFIEEKGYPHADW